MSHGISVEYFLIAAGDLHRVLIHHHQLGDLVGRNAAGVQSSLVRSPESRSRMERLHNLVLITMTTMLLFLILCSSVTARPHIAPRLTLADLDEDGAIPKNDAAENDDEGYPLPPPVVQFEAVDLPSHFETYDRNHDRRVSLKELSLVSGTKETDARMPFEAADIDHDGKLSFEEFRDAPWNFGEVHQFDSIEQLILDLADDEA